MYSSLIQSLRERRDGLGEAGADSGFTLIELMVVLLILAILLAIAIPAFLGATNTANDRAAQSNLNTAQTDAKVCYTNNSQSYTACTTTVLQTSESSLTFVAAGGSTSETQITVLTAADGNAIMLATWSPKTSPAGWSPTPRPPRRPVCPQAPSARVSTTARLSAAPPLRVAPLRRAARSPGRTRATRPDRVDAAPPNKAQFGK